MRATTVSPWVEFGLRFIGMWSTSSYTTVHCLSYISVFVTMQYFQYTYVVVNFDSNNLMILTDCLGLALANSLVVLKVFCLWWNRRIFRYVLLAMDKDWNECISCDSHRIIMMEIADLSRRCSYVLIGLHAMTGFILSLGIYIVRSMNNADTGNGTVVREFPVKMKFPFEINESPVFECILIAQVLYTLTAASTAGMINALLASLVLHVSGQIDIMSQGLLQIPTGEDHDKSFAAIRKLIFKHCKIIALAGGIENVFSTIALLQLLWNTLVICCSGFLIVISVGHKAALVKSVFMYLVKTLEVFVFCYAGEFLSAKSKSVSDVVYETLWYDMLPSNSRVLLFIIMRSQKRLTITAGKIVDLSLEGFMSVMKASASYMSVLHAMY